MIAIPSFLPVLLLALPQSAAESGVRRPTEDQLRTAQWVAGRVVRPEGTPASEQLTVVADATGLPAFGHHESPVAADGSFRVAFAADARRGLLRVQGRYVFLEPPQGWKSGDQGTDVVLQPALGALVRGHVTLPADTDARERAEVVAAVVEVEGTPLAPGKPTVKRSVPIGADLAFEAPALPDGYAWSLTLAAGPFVPFSASVARAARGASLDAELKPTRGARLRGRVLDEAGRPVARAAIGVVMHADPLAPAPADSTNVRTGGDGVFEIRGVAPGNATIWPEREGWISTQKDLDDLREGEMREGISLLLRTGNVLSGRVLDPAGGPAAGARVRVTQSSLGRADLVSELVTTADGSFTASGLGDEPVEVLATSESIVQDVAAPQGKAAAARKRVLRAAARMVSPKESGLELRLVAGLVIEGRVHDDLGRMVQAYTIGARQIAAKGAPPLADPRSAFKSFDVRSRDGTFVLEGLEPGMWDVYAFGRGIVYEPARRITVPYEGDPLLFVVRRPAVIAGVVLDAQKNPVADVVVEATWERPALYEGAPTQERTSVTCGRDGRFELTDVYPGAVHVAAKHEDGRASAPIALELAPGERKEAVEVVLAARGSR